jgi:polyphosphate kinase
MISSNLNETEPILNLKDLFYEIDVSAEIKQKIENIPKNSINENMKLLQQLQSILQKCAHLTEKQKLLYCESQRYFMKLYLRDVNRQK